MYEQFIRNKITELRLQKNVSEYKMSLDLGHSKSYIQSISSGRALPSMIEFISICEYFNITPSEFFNEKGTELIALTELQTEAKQLNKNDIKLLTDIAKRLNK